MGNCSRFINHADLGKENLFSQNIFTEGRCKIGFYAIRDIDKDE
jgi:SET domain-containing protein